MRMGGTGHPLQHRVPHDRHGMRVAQGPAQVVESDDQLVQPRQAGQRLDPVERLRRLDEEQPRRAAVELLEERTRVVDAFEERQHEAARACREGSLDLLLGPVMRRVETDERGGPRQRVGHAREILERVIRDAHVRITTLASHLAQALDVHADAIHARGIGRVGPRGVSGE